MSEFDRVVELLTASPGPQLWTDPAPAISGSGFVPVTEVKLQSRCRDGAGRTWSSLNGYLVSAETRFHTALTPGVGDDYYGIADEGPIYSMRCQEGPGHDFVLPEDGRLELEFELHDGGQVAWQGSTVRVTDCRRESRPDTTVYFLHNAGPGASQGEELLRSHGFEVMARAVLTAQLDLDPLWAEIRSCQTPSVYLVASGRASEAALEIAQRVKNLSGVILFSGSGLRFSPWRIDGRDLPHVQCDHAALQPRGQSVVRTRTIYADAVIDRKNRDQGRIEVEKIACPLHLFTGSDDQIWPSSAFSELAAQRRKLHGREADTHHLTFPSVGHDLGPELGLPALPTTERTIAHSSTGFRLALGGKMGRQARARRECWDRLIAVLNAPR